MADIDIPPGEPEAMELGCLCQPNDGEELINPRWPDWHVRGCPLHDPNAAPCDGCGECGRLCGG